MKGIIRKELKAPCGCVGQSGVADKNCKRCKGTGIYIEDYYYMTNGKIAFDGDTVK